MKMFALVISSIVLFTIASCSFSLPDFGDTITEKLKATPKTANLTPSKFPDTTNSTHYNTYRITFTPDYDYLTNLFTNFTEDEFTNVYGIFHIEAADSNNNADNNTREEFKALVDGVYMTVPRTVGFLDYYSQKILYPFQNYFTVEYTASDISGIYRIWCNLIYSNSITNISIISNYSTVTVKIPDLIKVNRAYTNYVKYLVGPAYYISNERTLYTVSGTNERTHHSNNNYLQDSALKAWKKVAVSYVQDHYYNYNMWVVLDSTDMSTPWGGMFFIGYTSEFDASVTRKDGRGQDYTVYYRAYIDKRAYYPPHKTHREGTCIDIALNSGDGFGRQLSGVWIEKRLLQDTVETYGFTFVEEGTHFHIEYKGVDCKNYY